MSFALRRLHRWIQRPKKPQKQARLTSTALIRRLQTLINLHLLKLMNLIVRRETAERQCAMTMTGTS